MPESFLTLLFQAALELTPLARYRCLNAIVSCGRWSTTGFQRCKVDFGYGVGASLRCGGVLQRREHLALLSGGVRRDQEGPSGTALVPLPLLACCQALNRDPGRYLTTATRRQETEAQAAIHASGGS